MNLYEIQKQFADIVAALEENGGELTPELDEAIAINGQDFAQKGENYIMAIRNLEAQAAAFKAEMQTFKQKMDRAAKSAETLKICLLSALRARDINKQTFGNFTASCRKSEKVMVDEYAVEALPDQYKRVKIEADKTSIKEALKNGEVIEGCELIENYTLQIK